MKENCYLVQLKKLDEQNVDLHFEFSDKEDIVKLINILSNKFNLSKNESIQLSLGIRLLGTFLIKNHKKDGFKNLMPIFKELILEIKSKVNS